MAKSLIRASVRVQGREEFNRVAKEYSKWNERQPQEVVVAKAYFIDLRAMNTTKTTTKEQIREKLMASSKVNPKVALAPVLVNWQLGKKGKKGLTGAKMVVAVEKFTKKQTSRPGAARAAWIGGLKTLDYWNKKGDVSFSKQYAPKRPQGVRQYGKPKGWAQIVRRNGMCSVTVANEFGKEKKQASPTIDKVLNDGLDKAFAYETTSMISYINKKYEAKHAKMNRIHTYH